MSTVHTTYSGWLTSIGNPEHFKVIGPDWWLCTCGEGNWKNQPYNALAQSYGHMPGVRGVLEAEVSESWTGLWTERPPSDLHWILWRDGVFTEWRVK